LTTSTSPARETFVRWVIVAVAYYAAARVGLRLALVGQSVTPLWPPTGLALVALLAWRRRMWPAILVAAFAVNAPITPTYAAAAVIAVGNTIAPIVAVLLLQSVGFRARLDRVRDAVALIFLGALVSMTISATIGSLALVWSNADTAGGFMQTWLVWWTGDAMGVLIFAPFLWAAFSPPPRGFETRSVIEIVAIVVVLAGACELAFVSGNRVMFVVLPVVGWTAWRFAQRGASVVALAVSVAATIAAVHDAGPFRGESLSDAMVALQSFNATVAFTAIFIAAAVTERERTVERQHQVAETLQRSLLPETLPTVPDVAVAARYIPASADVELGGDWYDIIALRDGRIAFAVGDVAGHGVAAAAAMGQIRMALRAYALIDLTPSQALGRLNRMLEDLQPGAMATVWYGHYDPVARTLVFSNAGHLPPLLIGSEGTFYLEEVHGPPIGAVATVDYRQGSCRLAIDATLILYTDGLVERRRVPIDTGLLVLRDSVRTAPRELEPLCDHFLRALLDAPPEDDVALLAIRPLSLVDRPLHLTKPAIPSAVPEARRAIRSWLQQNSVPLDDTFEILVATSEAHTNAVRHAYGVTPGIVKIAASIAGDELQVSVKDEGTWRTAPSHYDGGRGIALMRSLMDDVEIESTSEGTEVRMRRMLPAPSGARRPVEQQ
jgi:integral membrane sensor domain MASE1/anti-sigma regulatory factor (Ser/Thr protein kinase)